MEDKLSPEDEAMLARCFSRFKCRLMLLNIGISTKRTHPVPDEEYQKAMQEPQLCEDCPPVGYPTDKTRCLPCPRRSAEHTK